MCITLTPRNATKRSAESIHRVKQKINMLHAGGHANHHRRRQDDETAKAKAKAPTTTTTTTNHSPELKLSSTATKQNYVRERSNATADKLRDPRSLEEELYPRGYRLFSLG